jgi:prolyl oligopeptidase
MAEPDRARLSQTAQEIIAAQVVPAFRQLKDFFVNGYLPAASDRVGIWQLPNGAAMYAHAARHHTTTNLSPSEVHELGLSEVRRIRAEMHTIIDKLGFLGSFAEFAKFLRSEPKFYFKSESELLEAYRALSRRIDPALVKVFRNLPRMPYGIEPVPANVAPDSPVGLYRSPAADGSRSGTFLVNTHEPEIRPKYEMMVLSLHEAVPGHHLQIALAMEQKDLPNFRRYGGYTAFVEGWGLYAESLGGEMGLYDDPYSKFGQLMYEIWRASRLVVDTGMHYLRWERQKAIDYMVENTAKQEVEIAAEVDRYIVWPGQALAYKVGQLKISELRAKAKLALADKFDIRDFHDELLKDGPLPLDQLETKMNAWIDKQKSQ